MRKVTSHLVIAACCASITVAHAQALKYRSEAVVQVIQTPATDGSCPPPQPVAARVEYVVMRALAHVPTEKMRHAEQLPESIDELRQNMELRATDGTHLVASFVGTDPAKTQRVADWFAGRVSADFAREEERAAADALATLSKKRADLRALIEKRPAPKTHVETLEAEAQDAAYRDLVLRQRLADVRVADTRSRPCEMAVLLRPAGPGVRVGG